MNRYSDLIDSDPVERDPHEHEADADLLGMEDGDGDSDTDGAFDTEPEPAFDGDDDTPGATDQPQNERPKAEQPAQQRKRTVRDDEDTSQADDVDEEQEEDEAAEYAEVDDSDEESILDDIYEEPQLYRAQFAAQEVTLPDPEPAYDTEQTNFEPEYDALDDWLDELTQLDAKPFVSFTNTRSQVDDLVSLEPDDMADPMHAFRWFSGEDVFDEASDDEWFTP